MRWWRRAWRGPGGTGRRLPLRPISSRASWSAAPSGCRSPSVTCWTTRPSSARRAPRWRSGWPAGELTVRDHGPGIAPADLPHVFDRFYRAASARGVPGSGLGLAIVRQVAESHGGTVRAEVRARRGHPDPAPPAGRRPPGSGARGQTAGSPTQQGRRRYRRGAGAGILQSQTDRARLIGLRRRGTDAVLAQDPRHLAGDPGAAGCGGVQAVMRARERPSRRQRIDDDHVAVRGPAGRHDRMVGPVGGGRA